MTNPGEGQIAALDAEDAAAPVSSAPNLVNVGPCRCPHRPHRRGDTVTLHPAVTIPLGVAALAVLRGSRGVADVYGGLAEVYLQLGIADWSFTDENRAPIRVTPDAITRLLPFGNGGLIVADAADALYASEVMRPLRAERPDLFPSGPTESSTSPNPASGSKRPTPLRRSSQRHSAGRRSA